jgi:hypothetical protein
LTVELTGVTHLASAGVAVLRAFFRAGRADAPLRLIALPDSWRPWCRSWCETASHGADADYSGGMREHRRRW